MKLTKNLVAGLAAFALTAIVSHAQPTISGNSTYATGDLVLTFSTATSAADVDFDIGSLSSYQGLSAGTYTVSAFNATGASDVTSNVAAFGANTKWWVAGYNPNSTNEFTLTASSSFNNNASYSTVGQEVDSAANGISFGNGSTADDAIDSGKNESANVSFVTGDILNGPTKTVYSGTSGTTTSLNLYDVDKNNVGSGAAILLGTFTLNTSTDVLTFTVIPEPSTYAAILGALTVGFVLVRRRFGSSSLSAA